MIIIDKIKIIWYSIIAKKVIPLLSSCRCDSLYIRSVIIFRDKRRSIGLMFYESSGSLERVIELFLYHTNPNNDRKES